MLIAIDQKGEKRVAYQDDTEFLKKLTDANELFCPCCQNIVKFFNGRVRIPHFKHKRNDNCSFNWEPETPEHFNGKVAIYNWLKKQYPTAYITLEQHISKTNQIADVYAEFGNGIRFAFEVQCAPMSVTDWIERRLLYRNAGIRDIWLFGMKNYFKEKEKNEYHPTKSLLQLNQLLQAVNKREHSVLFLDSENLKVKQFGDIFGMSDWTETRFLAQIHEITLSELHIIQTASPYNYHLGNPHIKSIHDKYFAKRRRTAKDIWDERVKFLAYKRYLRDFNIEQERKNMNEYEQKLFDYLIKEYGLSDTNFPGIFKVKLINCHLIKTASPLWQLIVFHLGFRVNQHHFYKIFIEKMLDELAKYVRFDEAKRRAVGSLVYSYLVLLENCGFLSDKHPDYAEPFTILTPVLPIVDSKKFNNLVATYYYDFSVGHMRYGNYDSRIFKLIKSKEMSRLKQAKQQFDMYVSHRIEKPYYFDTEFLKWVEIAFPELFQELDENGFISELLLSINANKVVTKGEYDTFLSIIEDRFNL